MKLEIDEDNVLSCPACGEQYTHQITVYSMENVNDSVGSAPLITDFKENRRKINPNIKMPYRGNSIVIKFWCENCDKVSHLYISQHKGRTFIEFIDHEAI